MLRVKNILPSNIISFNPNKVIKCNLDSIQIYSFKNKISSVDKCLKIILWGYHLCKIKSNYEIVLEVPLKYEVEKLESVNPFSSFDRNKSYHFDIGFYDKNIKRYTHFIEYDGFSSHFTDVKKIEGDILKERFCSSLGVSLLRISPKYELNLNELDNWFSCSSCSSGISYFNKEDYEERNKIAKKMNL